MPLLSLRMICSVSQAAAAGWGKQRAEVVCPLSSSKHRETRRGESNDISSPASSCLPSAPFLQALNALLHPFLQSFFPGEEEAAGWHRSHVRQAAGGDGDPQEDGWQAEPRAPPEPEGEGVHSGGGAGFSVYKISSPLCTKHCSTVSS